jgi:hypothetical protein
LQDTNDFFEKGVDLWGLLMDDGGGEGVDDG